MTVNSSVFTPPTQFVFILGMHRSGTSCLTGALEACGLLLQKVNRGRHDNARGNLENRNVQRINDRILRHNQGKWDNPPDSISVTEEHKQWIQDYLASLSSDQKVGIKDPRLVLLPEAWFSAAGTFLLAGTFRHPMAVALSLQKRNSLPIEEGFRLWKHYNERLLSLHGKYNFPLVEYDLNRYEQYCEKVAMLASRVGLMPSVDSIQQFVSTDLQNSRLLSDEVPTQCRELYFNLKAFAL